MKHRPDERSHKDPVCGMVVSRLTAVAEAEYRRKTYYFCAQLCRDGLLGFLQRLFSKILSATAGCPSSRCADLGMKRRIALLAVAFFGLPAAAQTGQIPKPSPGLMPNPSAGKALYEKNCASCHGPELQGTDKGPPFLHRIYESSHHGDVAFQMAAENGACARTLGSSATCSPVPGLKPDEGAHHYRGLGCGAGGGRQLPTGGFPASRASCPSPCSNRPYGRGDPARSGLRDGGQAGVAARDRTRRPHDPLLQRQVPGEVRGRAAALPVARIVTRSGASAGRAAGHGVHLPDAPGSCATIRRPARSAAWPSSRCVPRHRGPPENAELVDFRRRFFWTLPLSAAVFVLGMSDLIPGQPVQHALGGALAWVELVLATPVVVWAGWPLLARGAASLRTRHLNMFTLIALGTVCSVGL